jgi:hypothetical protein
LQNYTFRLEIKKRSTVILMMKEKAAIEKLKPKPEITDLKQVKYP